MPGQAHAPAPLARQDHQDVRGEGVIAAHDRHSWLNPQAVPIPDLLRDLLVAPGPSGNEEQAAAVWRAGAKPFAAVTSDTLGTSFARVAGGTGPTIALVGHIDEIGVVVTHIESSGLVSFSTLGGFDAEIMAGQRVVLAGRGGPVAGLLVPRTRRDRGDRNALRRDDLHIDIGAADRDDAAARVRPGDTGVWRGDPVDLPNGRFASKALDNRLGAYAVLEAARRLADGGAGGDVVAVASVQEETGHDGAGAAAYGLEPDVAIVVDVTWATDVPGESAQRSGAIELGSGVAIGLGPVVNRRVSDVLLAIAEEDAIPHTTEVMSGRTHTDADDVHRSRGGVPTGIVSIPIRYMHTPCELGALDDLEATIALMVAFGRRLTPETNFLR